MPMAPASKQALSLAARLLVKKYRIMMVYPEGNHITSSHDTPYLQIGESKYGKPILDRILTREVKRSWDQRLKDAFRQMPPFAWAAAWDKKPGRAVSNDDLD